MTVLEIVIAAIIAFVLLVIGGAFLLALMLTDGERERNPDYWRSLQEQAEREKNELEKHEKDY